MPPKRTRWSELEASLQLLNRASALLASSLDYEATLQSVTRLAIPALADWCAVALLDEQRTLRRVAAAHADPSYEAAINHLLFEYSSTRAGSAIYTHVIETRESCLISHVSLDAGHDFAFDDETQRLIQRLGLRSVMLVPLIARAHTLGLMAFCITTSDRFYDNTDLALAESLANRCALAVDNARLYHEGQEALARAEQARVEAEAARSDAEQHAERLSQWSHMFAHDIRQPLGVAVIHAQLVERLLELSEYDRAGESVRVLMSALIQLRGMIHDLVDSARIATGRLSANLQPVDLTVLLSDFLTRSAPVFDVSRIRVDLAASVTIVADQMMLARVLGNLVSNAIKYSDPGTTIMLRVRSEVDEAIISIADQGYGIEPEDLPRIFERGFRSPTARRTTEGLGLGLYLARLFVEAQNGRIWVDSRVGQGSTFSIALPLAS